MKVLDVGCGRNKTEGATGIDFVGSVGADVLHNFSGCGKSLKFP